MKITNYHPGALIKLITHKQLDKIANKHKPYFIDNEICSITIEDVIEHDRLVYVTNTAFDKSTDKFWLQIYVPKFDRYVLISEVLVSKLIKPFSSIGMVRNYDSIRKTHKFISFECNGETETIAIKDLSPKIIIVKSIDTTLIPLMVYIGVVNNKSIEIRYKTLVSLASIGYSNDVVITEDFTVKNIKLI